ncbi:8-amino-7-oxononanoate synthase [Sphingomonas jatrophae]|uniref:8-amino-7-oxononanoate synthase n=1 Tax=Sphingomonas jatrophae TaxID=1166337 RepID=A0A1I6JZS1_9SPHN|nr:8-amino-7-oxononanoate synthase [Sphingomonas jatrophae]SFR84473.1 8-amino-7-oxononanoate synthase [Sphingomonas jatrophae]
MSLLDDHRGDLAKLHARDRLRTLRPRDGVDFASNDYLALAGSARLAEAAREAVVRGVPIGSGGSRLLRGNHAEHEALEAEGAAWTGAESALFFGAGFAANAALFAALPRRGDLVVHDALIHASAHDGMRLARAEHFAAAHNDADAFADAIQAWRRAGGRGRAWIAVESLYSMDGDQAPLEALAAVADRHDAFLLIDEAHAGGVFGPDGRGLAAALQGLENVVTLHTLGKALGAEGALVSGPAVLRDVLVNRARPFIFSTAPSPLMAAVAREAIRAAVDEPERRERLSALVAAAERLLARVGVEATGSQILPLIVGRDAEAMRLAAACQAAGFDVRGIRPPTVPLGSARLRISLTLNASETDVAALVDVLADARARP